MRFFAIVFSILAIAFPFSEQATAQNIDVWAENVHTTVGAKGFVRFYASSNVPLSGLRIPIKLESTALIIDSVVVGPLTSSSLFNIQILFTEANRRGFVNILPKLGGSPATFVPYDEEVLRIYYYVKPGTTESSAPVDTFYHRFFDANFWIIEQIEASDELGLVTYHPDFQSGMIWIDQATDVEEDGNNLPLHFALDQNFPNPFNPTTTIAFSTDRREHVRLEIFDILGRSVATLVDGVLPSGRYEQAWEANSEPSGTYFYRLSTSNGVILRKMTLLK